MSELNVDNAEGMVATLETLGYYFNMKVIAQKMGKDAKLPEAVTQIIDLAKSLPKPELANWSAQATGKVPSQAMKAKAKAKATTENGDDKKPRGQWTEESKQELVQLVESEEFRKEKLGSGAFVWAAMARHFGFSKATPLQRQYQLLTGKEPPGMRPKKEEAAGTPDAEGAPAAKKAKVEAAPAPPAAASSDGWTEAQRNELVRLVDDEKYRKEKTGKSSLKFSRIAEYLDKGKKECKKKYTAITGKQLDD